MHVWVSIFRVVQGGAHTLDATSFGPGPKVTGRVGPKVDHGYDRKWTSDDQSGLIWGTHDQ